MIFPFGNFFLFGFVVWFVVGFFFNYWTMETNPSDCNFLLIFQVHGDKHSIHILKQGSILHLFKLVGKLTVAQDKDFVLRQSLHVSSLPSNPRSMHEAYKNFSIIKQDSKQQESLHLLLNTCLDCR